MGRTFRHQLVLATGLAALAVALRLPFTSHYLWAWDSVLYAGAMDDFDVSAGRPHPPGSLFYVLLARVLALVTRDPNAALVAISVIAGAAVVPLGLVVGWRAFGAPGAAITAGVLLADPLLWHYSEIAYPYSLLALLGGAVGAALWWSARGGAMRPVAASLALGLAAGFRQDLLLVLFPLWLWSATRRGPRSLVACALALGGACLVWLIPTAALSGGMNAYAAVVASQLLGIAAVGGGASELDDNLRPLLVGVRWQLLWALPLVVMGILCVIRRSRDAMWPLALWTVPAVLTYLFLHIGEWAYTLSIAVPLALVAGAGGAWILRTVRTRRAGIAVATAIVALLLLNGWSFTFGHGRFTARAIAGHDTGLATWVAYVRAEYPPDRTLLVAREGFQHARFYLPEYRALYAGRRATARWMVSAMGADVDRLVLFLGDMAPRAGTPSHRVRLPSGVDVADIAVGPGSRLLIEGRLVALEEAPDLRPVSGRGSAPIGEGVRRVP